MSDWMRDDVLWRDRKRHCGMPLSRKAYAISRDRLLLTNGLLQQDTKQVMLYNIRDISFSRRFGQLLFGVGTVSVTTRDKEVIDLENVCAPAQVMELLHENVERQKQNRGFRYGDFLDFDR